MRVIGILLALAVFDIASSSFAESVMNRPLCHRLKNWQSIEFQVPEGRQYIPVAVRLNSYVVLRRSVMREVELKKYLKSVFKKASKQPEQTPYVLLSSNHGVNCDEFSRAAKIVSNVYGCEKNKVCIWGYGMGEKARPANIPTFTEGRSR